MSSPAPAPLVFACALALLLLVALVPAPAAPAAAPKLQLPTPTPLAGTTGPLGPGSSFGDPHLRTLDGLDYDFQAAGEFIAVQSMSGDLALQIRQEPLGTSTVVSINTAAAMSVAGDRVGLYVREQPPLRVNGQPTALDDGTLPLPGGGRVERQGDRYTIVWPDQSTAAVTLHSQYLDVVVRLAATRQGQVAGLFGNGDGNTGNDFVTRGGNAIDLTGLAAEAVRARLYGEFGASWQITQPESLFDYGPGEDTLTYARPDLPSALVSARDVVPMARSAAEVICRAAGVTAADVLADCVLDVGLTGNAEFAASAAAVVAEIGATGPTRPTSFRGNAAMPIDLVTWFVTWEAGATGWTMPTFNVEVGLDPVTGQPVSGSMAVELVNPDYERLGGGRTYRLVYASDPAITGTRNGEVGTIGFGGTVSLYQNPPTDPQPTVWGGILPFSYAFNDSGQLVLCRGFTAGADAGTQRNECLASMIAVLDPAPSAAPPA